MRSAEQTPGLGGGRGHVAAPQPRDIAGAELADVVSRLRRAMRRAARAADPGARLSVAQLELLSCLAENPGARPSQVARLLRLAPSSEATLAGGLQRAGLVAREGGGQDRRTASLQLTETGASAVSRWQTLNEQLLHSAVATLDPAAREALAAALPALRELAGAIDALADAPPDDRGNGAESDAASPGEPGWAAPAARR